MAVEVTRHLDRSLGLTFQLSSTWLVGRVLDSDMLAGVTLASECKLLRRALLSV